MMTTPEEGNPFLDALPPEVRAAVLAQDVRALELALHKMPRDEAEALAKWLVIAGVLVKGTPDEVEAEQPFANYPPAVAAALASGNTDAVYAALADLAPAVADRLYEQLQQQGLL